MKIFLKDINHFFLTVDTNSKRKHHMVQEFSDYKLTEINTITGIEKKKSGAIGFLRMIDAGLSGQDPNKPFRPFIMYEDDCSKYRQYPEYIELPDNSDICYIGLSTYSITTGNNVVTHTFLNQINNDVVRIYNMLATHGILVTSAAGASAMQKSLIDAYYMNDIVAWDIPIASIQSYYNVYALKTPLVFQDSKYGGFEDATRFCITSTVDSPLPHNFINKDNLSSLTSILKINT
jgi:hypothetical protein